MSEEKLLSIICGAPDRPLHIANTEIPCYVLENEMRVLVQRSMIKALSMSRGSAGRGGDRLAQFLAQERFKGHVPSNLMQVIQNPIKFRASNGSVAFGYEAQTLAEFCFAVIDADRAKPFQTQQQHIVQKCRILIKGFAIVGINALVDEATGYQSIRDKRALHAILDRYLRKELAAWAKKFPDEFYRQMFRLRGWEWRGMKINRPSCVGNYTIDLVYDRLLPGLYTELKARMPLTEAGNRKGKLTQLFNEEVGDPALQNHLSGIVALQRAAPDRGGLNSCETLNAHTPS